MKIYDIGDKVRLSAVFTNSAGTVVDPGSVTLQYRRWLADVNSFTTISQTGSIAHPSTGVFYADIAFAEDGEWRYRFNGFGDNAGASEGIIKMRQRSVG